MELISIKNLTVKYGNTLALEDISLSVFAGDYIGIVGPNGSGKSSLIKAILNLIPVSQGSINLLNNNKIGYLPQKNVTKEKKFPANVKEIISLGLLRDKGFLKKITKKDEEMIENTCNILEIKGLLHKEINSLSGGQEQRVHLARALVNSPQVLILDEPTNALDPQARDSFYQLLKRLNTENNVTILLVTHDAGTIGNYAKKLLYLDKKLVYFGGFDDFCSSDDMTNYFGFHAQHYICKRHAH